MDWIKRNLLFVIGSVVALCKINPLITNDNGDIIEPPLLPANQQAAVAFPRRAVGGDGQVDLERLGGAEDGIGG